MNILELIEKNLINVGWAMAIFLTAYLSNMCFSLYLNIGLLKQSFDKEKFLKSVIKAAVFIAGLALLTTSVTVIPQFAELMSWTIPTEFTEIFSGIVIVATLLYVTCRYAVEAFQKFKAILDYPEIKEGSNV